MNLLALDTSTEHLSLALRVGEELHAFDEAVGNATSAHILPQIQILLNQADVTLNQLNGIAFGAGPGSFTGVRIAAGVTQGLAFGANLPVVGVCTLLALAESAGADRVIACLDARMGEVYHAAYEKKAGTWLEVLAPSVCKPESVPTLDGGCWVGVGSGFKTYLEKLTAVYGSQLTQIRPNLTPSATAILKLASPIFASGNAKNAHEAMPIYIRNRVALTTQEREQAAFK